MAVLIAWSSIKQLVIAIFYSLIFPVISNHIIKKIEKSLLEAFEIEITECYKDSVMWNKLSSAKTACTVPLVDDLPTYF